MLACVVGSVVAVAVAIVVIVAFLEIRSRKRANYYAQQGFSPELSTGISGMDQLVIKGLSHPDNVMEPLYQRVLQAKREGFPGIVFNIPQDGSSQVLLIDGPLIRELTIKENEYCYRKLPTDVKINSGFFVINGEQGLAQRTIFSEFFQNRQSFQTDSKHQQIT
jgi:hypothetical protein